jgi:hypothetical protein
MVFWWYSRRVDNTLLVRILYDSLMDDGTVYGYHHGEDSGWFSVAGASDGSPWWVIGLLSNCWKSWCFYPVLDNEWFFDGLDKWRSPPGENNGWFLDGFRDSEDGEWLSDDWNGWYNSSQPGENIWWFSDGWLDTDGSLLVIIVDGSLTVVTVDTFPLFRIVDGSLIAGRIDGSFLVRIANGSLKLGAADCSLWWRKQVVLWWMGESVVPSWWG